MIFLLTLLVLGRALGDWLLAFNLTLGISLLFLVNDVDHHVHKHAEAEYPALSSAVGTLIGAGVAGMIWLVVNWLAGGLS